MAKVQVAGQSGSGQRQSTSVTAACNQRRQTDKGTIDIVVVEVAVVFQVFQLGAV